MKALRFSTPMFSSKVKDEMELQNEKAARLYSEEKQNPVNSNYRGVKTSAVHIGRISDGSTGGSKVFPEDHEPWEKGILDPGSELMLKWNKIFLAACIIALFVDPLYFYLASVKTLRDATQCIVLDKTLSIVLTLFRTLADLFYIIHIVIKFRTAYVSPSARVFGRGELVMNRKKIASRYLGSDFFVDLFAALPLPQIVIWLIIPAVRGSNAGRINNALALIVFLQYLPRLYLIFPLSSQIIKAAGVVTKTAWAGAAYNLCLFMLASHVLGASWYLLSVYRQTMCWKSICKQSSSCNIRFLDCDYAGDSERSSWVNANKVFENCDANNNTIDFKYGIFQNALTNVVSENFCRKYFYCLWWGLQNLSSYAQNLSTTPFIGETLFAILIAILGLVLFALLIGNMQTYLQSITLRLEEWRLKRRDTEEWMRHRQLPEDLRERVRKYIQYKWLATRGVDEDAILQALPTDLRRDIQRHLCLDLVRRVPFFAQMDEPLLDAICERLVSCLSTEGTYIVREGDPVTEMLLIIRGKLESSTTNGGRTGFFDSTTLRPGDFCGEELLQWALLPKSSVNLPSSTRTVRALVEVEAFALRAEDLKFVANQFRRLHSKKLQHTVRFYSHHWRTWAACFIQAAWRRYKRRKIAKDLSTQVSFTSRSDEHDEMDGCDSSFDDHLHTSTSLGATLLASKFAATARKGAQRSKLIEMAKLQKPAEHDYSFDSFE